MILMESELDSAVSTLIACVILVAHLFVYSWKWLGGLWDLSGEAVVSWKLRSRPEQSALHSG